MTFIYNLISLILVIFSRDTLANIADGLNSQLHTDLNGWILWFVGWLIAIIIDKVIFSD